ncbi:P-loop NTPase fold protein (plasmid) [Pantoea sp. C3]|uniref:KAP family P-loop NTPase fold protein n=1 Tax=Pantoea phytostimulans TaxID=2769024 RepID=UPI0038F5E5F4
MMRLILPEIDYSEGFSVNNDIFLRQPLSKQLESIVQRSSDDSLVLAINDEWGTGKSTFLKLWQAQIENDNESNLKVIYFDAFKNDYQEDAFIALSSAIYPSIESKEQKINYLAATKKAGAFLFKTTAKVAISALTFGAVKEIGYEEAANEIKDSLNEPIENFIEEKLLNAEKEVEVLNHFKTAITKAAENKKIIFIIDELDRARPDFSLDLIEKIKHVFKSKNIFFILAINKSQFINVIKKRYGNIDAETYLSKFIHFWFSLPNHYDNQSRSQTISTFINHINKTTPPNGDYNESLPLLAEILTLNNCSLRDAERCYSTLLIIAASGGSPARVYQYATAILVYLKIKKPEIFSKIKSKTTSVDEIERCINIEKIQSAEKNYISSLIRTDMYNQEQLNNALHNQERLLLKQGDPILALREMLPFFDNMLP